MICKSPPSLSKIWELREKKLWGNPLCLLLSIVHFFVCLPLSICQEIHQASNLTGFTSWLSSYQFRCSLIFSSQSGRAKKAHGEWQCLQKWRHRTLCWQPLERLHGRMGWALQGKRRVHWPPCSDQRCGSCRSTQWGIQAHLQEWPLWKSQWENRRNKWKRKFQRGD